MQVVAAALAVCIRQLADDIQAAHFFALQLLRQLAHGHAALGDLGVIEAEGARHGQAEIFDAMGQFFKITANIARFFVVCIVLRHTFSDGTVDHAAQQVGGRELRIQCRLNGKRRRQFLPFKHRQKVDAKLVPFPRKGGDAEHGVAADAVIGEQHVAAHTGNFLPAAQKAQGAVGAYPLQSADEGLLRLQLYEGGAELGDRVPERLGDGITAAVRAEVFGSLAAAGEDEVFAFIPPLLRVNAETAARMRGADDFFLQAHLYAAAGKFRPQKVCDRRRLPGSGVDAALFVRHKQPAAGA